jgi:hypothetical protein
VLQVLRGKEVSRVRQVFREKGGVMGLLVYRAFKEKEVSKGRREILV